MKDGACAETEIFDRLDDPDLDKIFVFISMGEYNNSFEDKLIEKAFKKIMNLYQFECFTLIEKDSKNKRNDIFLVVFSSFEREDDFLYLMLELGRLTDQDSIVFVKDSEAYRIHCSEQELNSLISSNYRIFDEMRSLGKVDSLGNFQSLMNTLRTKKVLVFKKPEYSSVHSEGAWERGVKWGLKLHLKARKVDHDLKCLLEQNDD